MGPLVWALMGLLVWALMGPPSLGTTGPPWSGPYYDANGGYGIYKCGYNQTYKALTDL